MTRLTRLRESFWFVPAVLTVLSAVLAEVLVAVDTHVDVSLGPFDWLLYRAGADGSRDVVGVIAGTSMAVASTSFSITIAVLALTSSSYGPRLVRNFMADRGNQLVLAVYVATFLYCLLVLRSIRVTGGAPFVPHLAVNVAVLFAIGNVGVLIYFIHHISDSIQVWTLTARVRGELRRVIDDLYPDDAPAGTPDEPASALPDLPSSDACPVPAQRPGYVLGVDVGRLLREAVSVDATIRLSVRPGSYVVDGEPLALLWCHDRDTAQLSSVLRSAIPLGSARSPHQDVEFAAQQLVEMAVRALSPGTNDPWTAINALDELSSCLVPLARRRIPVAERRGSDGQVRVVAPYVGAVQVLDLVADSMRHYALDAPSVVERTAQLIGRTGAAAHDQDLRARCLHHLGLLQEAFARPDRQSVDRDSLQAVIEAESRRIARAAVGDGPAALP